jgi:hypothetical protein
MLALLACLVQTSEKLRVLAVCPFTDNRMPGTDTFARFPKAEQVYKKLYFNHMRAFFLADGRQPNCEFCV